MRELHTLMAKACGAADAPEYRELRLGELQHIALESSALAAATGWAPRLTLQAGLPGTVEWIASSLRGAR